MSATASRPWFDDRGPAAVLVDAARVLGLDAPAEQIEERFAEHPAPATLRALVEVAASFGVEVRAFRADLDGIAGVPLPAVVHLQSPDRDETEFGLLIERTEDRFVLAGAGGGSITLSREQFLRRWTGILATLSVREGAVAPAAPRANRMWRLRRRLEAVGAGEPRYQVVARAAGVAFAGALALAGAVRTGSLVAGTLGAAIAAGVVVLSGAGAAVSFALLRASRVTSVPSATPRLSDRVCARGSLTDCEGVLGSKYARVFGVDLAALGTAFFVSALAVAAVAGLVPAPGVAPLLWLAIAFLLAAPESMLLIGVQVYPLRRICPLCMAVHAVVLAGAAAGGALLASRGAEVFADPGVLARWGALQALAFALGLGLVVPFVDRGIEVRADRTRLGWVAATPLGALAELAGRPRDIARAPEAAIQIGDRGAPLRIDALVHPMCSGCGPVVRELLALERAERGRVRLALHLPPRDVADRGDRELCAALSALGVAVGGEAAVERFLALEENPWPAHAEAARDGGASLLAAWVAHPRDRDRIDEALARGREAVAVADGLAVKLQRGTPTVLIGGRPWEAPVGDLASLLRHEPRLLASAIGVALDAREAKES